MKNKDMNFAEITDRIVKTIARDEDLFKGFAKDVGLPPMKFEFFLDNVEGKRREDHNEIMSSSDDD